MLGCAACGGVFLNHTGVRALLSEGHGQIEENATRLASAATARPALGAQAACPVCGASMARVDILGGRVTAFTCNSHGSWFDTGGVAQLRGRGEAANASSMPFAPASMLREPPPGLAPSGRSFTPTSLAVIAWLWIVGGSGFCLLSLPTLFEACSLPEQMAAEGAPPQFADATASYRWIFILVLLCAMLAAGAGVACGAALLRLREWGRRGLVVLTALLLIYVVGFIGVFIWTSLPALAQGTAVFPIAGAIGLVVLGGPIWLVLRHLRGGAIRTAMTA
jgi:hypothetical protein